MPLLRTAAVRVRGGDSWCTVCLYACIRVCVDVCMCAVIGADFPEWEVDKRSK